MKTIVVQCPNADVSIIVELLETNYISYIVKDYEPLASSEKHTKESGNSAQQALPGSTENVPPKLPSLRDTINYTAPKVSNKTPLKQVIESTWLTIKELGNFG